MTRRYGVLCCLLVTLLLPMAARATRLQLADAELSRRTHEAVTTWFDEQGVWEGGAWRKSFTVHDDPLLSPIYAAYTDVHLHYRQPDGGYHDYVAFYDASDRLIRVEYQMIDHPLARDADFLALSPDQQGQRVLAPIREKLSKLGITRAWTLLRFAQTMPPYSQLSYVPGQEPQTIHYATELIQCMAEDMFTFGEARVTYSTSHDVIERWDFPQPSMLNLPPELQEAALQASQL